MNYNAVLHQLELDIAQCMGKDRIIAASKLQKIRRLEIESPQANNLITKLCALVERSKAQRLKRQQRSPKIEFPAELPIYERIEEIVDTLRTHQVVIVAGETGSGKSTQLPKICLSLGLGISGHIGHTQPRRLAVRSIATKIASELNSQVGEYVGFKIRFHDRVGENTFIKLMTDGILLAEINSDRYLSAYDALIIDEAHERSLNIDFLLGYCKLILSKRPDFKIIITSATIDIQRFSQHFNDAPVIEVTGRTYPVETIYRPINEEEIEDKDNILQFSIASAIKELSERDRFADILVFLSSEREIRETSIYLKKVHFPNTEILPLYSRLSSSEQNKIFHTCANRRIILSTNVAETSVTIPGIRYVIDSGYARISRYSFRNKIQRLPIEKISQSSADQRKGRCGRLSDGICIRLYGQDDFNLRKEFTDPEILRTNLAAVILQMEYLKLGHIMHFPFVDMPDMRYVKAGYKILYELEAIDSHKKITTLGEILGRLPIDPTLGRMLVEANKDNCLSEVLKIVSVLSIQDPKERPMEAQQKAAKAHQQYQHDSSDLLSYINLWDEYVCKRTSDSKNQRRRYCQINFISYARMNEWIDIHRQLKNSVEKMKWRINTEAADYSRIHRAILTGLINNIGQKTAKYEYLGLRNTTFFIHPGSGVKTQPKWLVASELVDTGKLYARNIAEIDPIWVEQIAHHLVNKSYHDAYWDKKTSTVIAFEKVTLQGLTLSSNRRINYGKVDPDDAHKIFIQEALVDQKLDSKIDFYRHNKRQIATLAQADAKLRSSTHNLDHVFLFNFYEERIPKEVFSGKGLEDWLRSTDRSQIESLYLTPEILQKHQLHLVSEAQFPSFLVINGIEFKLHYRFEPGHQDDGVTLIVPLIALGQLSPEPLEWLIPGLIKEKIIALIKCLPKSIRKQVVPAPHYADLFLNRSSNDHAKSLVGQLTEFLREITSVNIEKDTWRLELLPEYYSINIRVIDGHRNIIAHGRDILILQKELVTQSQLLNQTIKHPITDKKGLIEWDFGDLPETVEVEYMGKAVKAYPALVDYGDSVSVEIFTSQMTAQEKMLAGLKRLFKLKAKTQLKYIAKNIPKLQLMCQYYHNIGTCAELSEELQNEIINRSFFAASDNIRTSNDFQQRCRSAISQLVAIANELSMQVLNILTEYVKANKSLKSLTQLYAIYAVEDIRQQIDHMIFKGFITNTPKEWMIHLPRFLAGIVIRIEKINRSPKLDQERYAQIKSDWIDYLTMVNHDPKKCFDNEPLALYRWMFEEMRISLFAQELKTSIPISTKRLKGQRALLDCQSVVKASY